MDSKHALKKFISKNYLKDDFFYRFFRKTCPKMKAYESTMKAYG